MPRKTDFSPAALVLLLVMPWPSKAQQGNTQVEHAPATDVNAANNPLTPRITTNFQDYFSPSLNRFDGRQANQFLLRGLLPINAFGVSQLVRFTLPTATSPTFPAGPATGLGDVTLFDLAVVPTRPVVFGFGPLLVMPTATSRTMGVGKWQAGAVAAAVSPQGWGVAALLVTYQHSFAGNNSYPAAEVVTTQPIATYNLKQGFYLRSSAVWTFNQGDHTTVVPVGVGMGKVWLLGRGNTVNAFVEPQYSVFRSGVGVPVWQVFTGVNVQLAL